MIPLKKIDHRLAVHEANIVPLGYVSHNSTCGGPWVAFSSGSCGGPRVAFSSGAVEAPG